MGVLKNTRQERFAQGMAAGKLIEDAYSEAGYTPDRRNACKLRETDAVARRISELLAERNAMAVKSTEQAVEALAIDREWVMGLLKENAERALQRVAVKDSEGNPTGEYKYDGAVANRALELLGKEMGMFIDRKEIGGPGDFARMNDAELDAVIAEEARALSMGSEGEAATPFAGLVRSSGRPN